MINLSREEAMELGEVLTQPLHEDVGFQLERRADGRVHLTVNYRAPVCPEMITVEIVKVPAEP